jgi:GNAT acetyltransferase
MVVKIEDTKKVASLFGEWQETIIWSCLQKVMGEIYADCIEHPKSSMAILGDFCFVAGIPNKELLLCVSTVCNKDSIIMVPQDTMWANLITDSFKDKAKRVTRYAIKKEMHVFDKEKLEHVVSSLPQEYFLRLIDREMYHLCKSNEWSSDLVSQFQNDEMFQELGLGVVILKNGEIVSGASSYSRYLDGLEVEIDTKREFRRKGLAYVSGAKLILECLKRDLYPSWDAQNKWSVALAEKLGYHFNHEYLAYEIYFEDQGKGVNDVSICPY